jgi:hypothetical protein
MLSTFLQFRIFDDSGCRCHLDDIAVGLLENDHPRSRTFSIGIQSANSRLSRGYLGRCKPRTFFPHIEIGAPKSDELGKEYVVPGASHATGAVVTCYTQTTTA